MRRWFETASTLADEKGSLDPVPIIAAFLAALLTVIGSIILDGCRSQSEAENAARVLEQNFRAAEDAIGRSLLDGKYRFYDLDVNLPLSEQKRIAGELDHDEYERVAEASSRYSLQVARARESPTFSQDDVVQLACTQSNVARGREALAELTEGAQGNVEAIARQYRANCRQKSVQLVAENFYDYYVAGNGPVACRALTPRVRRQLSDRSPNCDETIDRTRYADDPATAEVPSSPGRDVSATLRVGEREVGTLRLTDSDGDNAWHIVRVTNLRPVAAGDVDGGDAGG